MALQLITPPTALPLDLIEAKLQARVDVTDDDALISALVGAATNYAEGLTSKQLVAACWKQIMDSFPGYETDCAPYGRTFSLPGNAIQLFRHPVIQVVSVQYVGMDGTTQTVDPAIYTVDYSTEPVRIAPVFGAVWPIPKPQIGSVWVIFDAGYAAPVSAQGSNIMVRGWSPLSVGDAVRLSNSGGALPAPLKPLTDYFVQSVVSPGVYTLALTSGGDALTLTDTGSGTSYLGEIPEGIKSWMRIRMGSLYENRQETVDGRLTPQAYVDRLLDPYISIVY